MDGKDKREMNTIEKRRNSLAGKAVRGTLRSCLLLGAIALLLGLAIFGNTLVQRSISRASETAAKASVSAERGADSVGFAKEIMDVYRSLTPEERAYVDQYHAWVYESLTGKLTPEAEAWLAKACQPL